MKNILILLAAVAMLVVGLLWWHTPQRQSTHLPGKIAGSTELEPSSPTTVATQPMDLSRPVNITPEIWARALSIRTLALGQNHNIEFYARVVDQHGVGIVGARLKLDLSYVDESLFRSANFIHMQMGEEIKTKQIELISDPNGVIEVSKEKGTGLRLADLICPGYFWQMPEISGIDYRERRPRAGSVELEAAFDKNQRYNLIMWRKGETERLMNINFKVRVDALATNWYGINLITGDLIDVRNADFSFCTSIEHDAHNNPGRRFDFSSPEGLFPNSERFPYQVPTDAFVTKWGWHYEPYGKHGGINAYQLFRRQFYVKARNGRVAASITWEWPTEHEIQITGYLNPTGSRNLEPDSEKLITDPEEIRKLDEQTRGFQ